MLTPDQGRLSTLSSPFPCAKLMLAGGSGCSFSSCVGARFIATGSRGESPTQLPVGRASHAVLLSAARRGARFTNFIALYFSRRRARGPTSPCFDAGSIKDR